MIFFEKYIYFPTLDFHVILLIRCLVSLKCDGQWGHGLGLIRLGGRVGGADSVQAQEVIADPLHNS